MGLVDKLFGNKSEKEIKRIEKYVDAIEALDEKMQALSDEELRAKTQEFKDRLAAGETLDDLLVEAFAVVREAADRTIHLKHYRVQLMGGIILHQGRIAEMKTGEGKTLVSTLPAYLNALEGKGVHIVTVNDYLAKRDANWMGQVHQFLGLSVGVILNSYDNAERQAAYNCDITYITNNELGFDYLRDNMVIYKKDLVQRELNYAIVDEVDSVLIDEARTPLIISGQSGKSTDLYKACDVLARQMQRGTSDGELSKIDAIMGIDIEEDGDFLVNEKDKQVMLTTEGVKKVEQFFHIKNLADAENLEIQHNIILALRAHNLMFRDRDYVVKDNEVLIVDEFTGRIMPGRRYSDGLHQAIEAKEHVKVNRESKTLATITFQNFFNKYKKKAGMTGTAMTEDKEFMDIYGMDVVEIPTNKPMIRVDHEDAIYMTKKEKLNAVINDIVESHKKGQPVLVGTINIDTSECMHAMLCCTGCRTAKQISRNDQICICTTDTSRRFRSDTAWTHVTDTAASTAQSKQQLHCGCCLSKRSTCRIISKLLHTQHHFDCRVRHIVQHILLCRKCFAISCNRLHVIFRENFLVAVFILVSVFIYMFVCMSADRTRTFGTPFCRIQ